MQDIILLGIGGHAKSVVDSIEAGNQYSILGFLDVKEKQNETYRGYGVIGCDDDLETLFKQGIRHAFITIGLMGDCTLHQKLLNKLLRIGYTVPNIIDPSAILAKDVTLGIGNYIGKLAILNSHTTIGDVCIVNTRAIVEHDTTVHSYSHIAIGAILCGNVTIGQQTFIGAGSTIVQGISIGSHCLIGAASLIYKNTGDHVKIYGPQNYGVTTYE